MTTTIRQIALPVARGGYHADALRIASIPFAVAVRLGRGFRTLVDEGQLGPVGVTEISRRTGGRI